MAAFTYSEPQPVFNAGSTTARATKPSFWRRLVDRMVEARMAEARMHVNAHLMTMDDETLARYGVDRATLTSAKARPTTI